MPKKIFLKSGIVGIGITFFNNGNCICGTNVTVMFLVVDLVVFL
ncbi:hypothetical protein PAND9192_01894 [Photobacterium andalusiense]|uniref:Uncharacterized protein n=1 Tax=Photobacterium andalusiense TaxID=2204296 RepID=A0A1Y6MF79_9GAMM|nr:hypothetical protein PAND9192_01894 [Photobacterium andalusiense]